MGHWPGRGGCRWLYLERMPATTPSQDTEQTDEITEDDRVHHHARVGSEHPSYPDGSFRTLCGIRVRPRPEAARLPCCSLCALEMGGPCR